MLFEDSAHCHCSVLLSLVRGVMVMVEMLLRNLLMTMSCFVTNFFVVDAIPLM